MSWWEGALRLLAAVAVGCVIGVEREHKHRPAGMRTHMLVCLGAAMVAVLEELVMADTMALGAGGVTFNRGRMAAQVISGIGFLGAGTIFVNKRRIAGLTTAASLWNVGCLGLTIGMGYYVIGLIGCAVIMLTLTVMRKLSDPSFVKQVEISFSEQEVATAWIDRKFKEHGVYVLDMDMQMKRSDSATVFTGTYMVDVLGRSDYGRLLMDLADCEAIMSVHTVTGA